MDGRIISFCFVTRDKGRGEVNVDLEFCLYREIPDRIHDIMFGFRIDLLLVERGWIKGVEELDHRRQLDLNQYLAILTVVIDAISRTALMRGACCFLYSGLTNKSYDSDRIVP